MVLGWIGLPGSGKSYGMVREAYLQRKARPDLHVWTNMDLRLPGAPVRRMQRFPEDLYDVSDGLVLLDELNVIMPGRLWDKMPTQLMYRFMQVRKSRVHIYYSAQIFDGVEKTVREVTAETVEMTSYVGLGFFVARRYALGKRSLARGTSLFPFRREIAACYDTMELIAPPRYLDAGHSRSSSVHRL